MLVLTQLEPDRIAEHRQRDEFFWLDLEDPPPADLDRAGQLLGVHPAALEDSREWRQRPKLDTYPDHLLCVFYTARMTEAGEAHPIEVHVHLSGSWVFTVRRSPCTALDELHAQLAREPIHDEGYLVYRIFDTLTDAWYPVIDGLEEHVDTLERQVLLRARREQLPEIYRLRQAVRELLRTITSQREGFPPTADAIRELPGLAQSPHEWLRDVGDHLAQIAGELNRQNDDLTALTGTYFNANADRLNAVAARLTVVGTVFVIATLVTGFFGQNFGWLVNHIQSRRDFLIFGVGGLVVPIAIAGAVMWVKRRDLF
jgi:magnesium transporter